MGTTAAESDTHVVILTQLYSPEPVLFPPDIARELKGRGFKVSVITGYPNRPGGKLYAGYRQRIRFTETIDGIRVIRTPLVVNHSRKSLERIVNFLSFSLSALGASAEVYEADVVYVYATPATAAIPAQIWKLVYGIPYVLHVQDLWPESVTGSGMVGSGRVAAVVAAVMRPWLERLYRGAHKLITISPGMSELLVHRGISPESCEVVYNWADESVIGQKQTDSFSGGQLRLLYAGNLGPMQDLETVLEAASLMEDELGFSFKLAGGGILEASLRSSAADLSRTQMLGRLPRSEVADLYMKSDFQLVTLKDLPIFRTTVPSKLQSCLASGVPVITTVQGDVAELIRHHEAGIVAEPEDARSLAAAFRLALSMSPEDKARMGRNARDLYQESMSKSKGLTAITRILEQVAITRRAKVKPAAPENSIHGITR
jgi:colanic acid biosynthesis glycosyl transferase WcaI